MEDMPGKDLDKPEAEYNMNDEVKDSSVVQGSRADSSSNPLEKELQGADYIPDSLGDRKLMEALCYPTYGIVALFFLLTKPDDKRLRYHALNGLFLWIVPYILGILFNILRFIPYAGCILLIAGSMVHFVVFIYGILLAIKAYNGEKPVIPLITDQVLKYMD